MIKYLSLDSELHRIVCIDEIEETSLSHKWSKKAQKQLGKLNNDSNLTAALEAQLTLAVEILTPSRVQSTVQSER